MAIPTQETPENQSSKIKLLTKEIQEFRPSEGLHQTSHFLILSYKLLDILSLLIINNHPWETMTYDKAQRLANESIVSLMKCKDQKSVEELLQYDDDEELKELIRAFMKKVWEIDAILRSSTPEIMIEEGQGVITEEA